MVDDPEFGQVIQLQGDQRKNVQDFLLKVRTHPHGRGRGLGMCVRVRGRTTRSPRRQAPTLCLQEKLVKKDNIKIHGF